MRNTQLVLTPYMIQLMKEQKDFMYFPIDNRILVGAECEKFNQEHAIVSTEPRFIFRHTKDMYGRTGYICNARNTTMSLMLLDNLLK